MIKVTNFLNVTEGSPREGHGIQLIKLQVLYPPDVICNPELTVSVNTSINLACTIDASPSATIIWSKATSKVPLEMKSSHLYIHNAQVSDDTVYTCTATNIMTDSRGQRRTGVGNCRIRVNVIYPPHPLMSETIPVFEGRDFTLSLPVQSNPPPYRYEWKKDVHGSEFQMSERPPVLHNIQRSDAGNYIIRVTNRMNITQADSKEGHGIQMVKLLVLFLPEVQCKERYVINQNSSVNLTCSVKSSSEPIYINWTRVDHNQYLKYDQDQVLMIRNAHPIDGGVYVCTVTSYMQDYRGEMKTGSASCKMNVTVLSSPPPVSMAVFEGDDVALLLPMPPNPSLYIYEWKKEETDSFRMSYKPTIFKVQRSDAGDYIIRVRKRNNVQHTVFNDIYRIDRRVRIVLLYPVDVKCPGEYLAVRSTSVNLTCTVDGSPPPRYVTWNHQYMTRVSPHYKIENATLSHQGSYTCSATNIMMDNTGTVKYSSSSCSINLRILYPPPRHVSSTLTVFEHSNVTLSLSVSANPPPYIYQWKKNKEGLEFQISDIPPVLHNIERSDAGDYIIRVTNRMNVTGGDSREGYGVQVVKLQVLYAPIVHCQRNIVILKESSVNISCSVNSFPLPNSILWSKNESTINQDGFGTWLYIKSALLSDEGDYVCTVTNNMTDYRGQMETGLGSCRSTLTILYPPSPLLSANISVFEGNSTTLSLPVFAKPTPYRYEWVKEGQNYRIQVSDRPPVLYNIQKSDTGDYIIRVTNRMNITQGNSLQGHGVQIVRIHVLYKPIVNCKQHYVILRSTSVNISCTVDSFPEPCSVIWSKSGEIMGNGTDMSLIVEDVQISDVGYYTCTVTNNMTDFEGQTNPGKGFCRTNMTIVYPPPRLVMDSLEVYEGSNVTFGLHVSANPQPHRYDWKKNDPFSRFHVSYLPPLIQNILRSDAGEYVIKVTNRMNFTEEDPREGHGMQIFSIGVLYAPEAECQEKYVILRNSSVKLTCSVRAYPMPEVISWCRSESNCTIIQGKGNYLTMHDIQVNNSGVYTCTAINNMIDSYGNTDTGVDSCSMDVTVVYPPPPLLTATISVFEGSSVNISLPPMSLPLPHVYKWKKEGTGAQFMVTLDPPVIPSIDRSATGTYIIRVANMLNLTNGDRREGQGLQTIKVNVMYKPEVSCEQVVFVLLNSSVDLIAKVTSYPRTKTVNWVRVEDKDIDEFGHINETLNDSELQESDYTNDSLDLEDEFLIRVTPNIQNIYRKVDKQQITDPVATIKPSTHLTGSGGLSVLESEDSVISGSGSGNGISYTEQAANKIVDKEPGYRTDVSHLLYESDFSGDESSSGIEPIKHAIKHTKGTVDNDFISAKSSVSEVGEGSNQLFSIINGQTQTSGDGSEYMFSSKVSRDGILSDHQIVRRDVEKHHPAESKPLHTPKTYELKRMLISKDRDDDLSNPISEVFDEEYAASGNILTDIEEVHGSATGHDFGYDKLLPVGMIGEMQRFHRRRDEAIIDHETGSGQMSSEVSHHVFLEDLSGSESIIDGISSGELTNTMIQEAIALSYGSGLTSSTSSIPDKVTFSIDDASGSGFNLNTDDDFYGAINTHLVASGFRNNVEITKHVASVEEGYLSGEGSGSGNVYSALTSLDQVNDHNYNMSDVSDLNISISMNHSSRSKGDTNRANRNQYETYHIRKVQLSHEGMYQFTATNFMKDFEGKEEFGTGSCLINLYVLYPPPPLVSASLTVYEGSNVTLSLPPKCKPRPSHYRWKKDGADSDFNKDATPPVITNISRQDAGSYIIEITNMMNITDTGLREGRGLQHVTVTVLYPPVVKCRRSNIVVENFSLKLSCSIEAVPAPHTVIWSRGTDILQRGRNSFILRKVTTFNTGEYICSATNTMNDSEARIEKRTTNCSTNVTVLRPPIPMQSGKLKVFEGGNLNLSLSDPCIPSPYHYTWWKKVPRPFRLQEGHNPPLIPKIKRSAAGEYVIKMKNLMNVTQGTPRVGHGVQLVRVKVLYPPTINCKEEIQIEEGRKVNLTCELSHGAQFSTRTWSQGFEYLGNRSRITLHNSTVYDSGIYRCTAITTMVDSHGWTRTWTATCWTNLTVILLRTLDSPFGPLPSKLLPYVIYIIGGLLIVMVLVLVIMFVILAVKFRGNLSWMFGNSFHKRQASKTPAVSLVKVTRNPQ